MGSKKEGTMWHVRLRTPACQACVLSAKLQASMSGMHIVDHMLPFMSLSFSVSSLDHSQMDKVLCWNKGRVAIPIAALTALEQLWKCQTGLRWEKCREWDETADTSFPFIPSSEATFVTECFIYCEGPISRHLRFSPDINSGNPTHAITQTASCEPFVLP